MNRMVEFNIAELTRLSERLNGYSLSRSEETQLLTDLGAEVESQTRERFDTKKAPDGTAWADIAAATEEYLSRYFPSAQPPLVRTGLLRDSTQYIVCGSTVQIGQTKHYAEYLQDGTPKMPARPSLGLSDSDLAELGAITDDFLQRIMR